MKITAFNFYASALASALKKLFIGEQKPLPVPLSPDKVEPLISRPQQAISEAAPKELSCFAKGIIKSLDDDNEPWEKEYREYIHSNGIIIDKRYWEDDGGGAYYIRIFPDTVETSDYDREMILKAFCDRDNRAEQKIKDAEAVKIKPSIDYFNKLGCQ